MEPNKLVTNATLICTSKKKKVTWKTRKAVESLIIAPGIPRLPTYSATQRAASKGYVI